MTVNILGTPYKIIVKKYDEDEAFKRNNWVGYCDEDTKEIAVCDVTSHPDWDGDKTPESSAISERQTLRHEIVHAFLSESGLSFSALRYSGSWAKNEEMVDWIALQGPKIYKAWQEADAL